MAEEDLDALLDSALEDFKEEAEQVVSCPSFLQDLGLLPADLGCVSPCCRPTKKRMEATDPTRKVLQQTGGFPSIFNVNSP